MSISQASGNQAPLSNAGERPQLKGAKLHLARATWVLLAVFSLGIFTLSIPYHIINLSSNIPMSLSIALMQQGLSIKFYIAYVFTLTIILVLGYSITAFIIFFRKSSDWITIFVSIALLTFGVAVSSLDPGTSPLRSLVTFQPGWGLLVMLLIGLGLGLILLVFYLFPDGNFVPRWTRLLSIVWVLWLLGWVLLPGGKTSPESLSPIMLLVLRMLTTDTGIIGRMTNSLRVYSLIFILALWFSSGVIAQIYRYVRVSSPLEKRQTKWAVYGFCAAVIIYFSARLLPPLALVTLRHPGIFYLRYYLISLPISTIALLLIPVSIGISIHRFRLWDVDFLINRTIIYGALSAAIGLFYFVDVLLLQYIFSKLTGIQSTAFIVLSTLIFAALVRPLRRWLQNMVDQRFFRGRVNFRQVFTSFAREVRTIIDLSELLRTLVVRTTELLHIHYGAVYLQEDGNFILSESRDLPKDDKLLSLPGFERLELLQAGKVLSRPNNPIFPMLVPLVVPKTSSESEEVEADAPGLLGILALGPLRSGLHYSREDQSQLLSLADQAGTAIYVANLVQETQEETNRRMQAEQRLEVHRNSPLGQAEAFAQTLAQQPDKFLEEIHQLTQKAGKDPNSASLISNLPQVLEYMGQRKRASLAEGFNYLYQSQFTSELSPIGLRTIISSLETLLESEVTSEESSKQIALNALSVYQDCQEALETNSMNQIMDFQRKWSATAGKGGETFFLDVLTSAVDELGLVTEALHAYERVDSTQDKLAFLASAINNLRHADHIAHTELGSADRPIIAHIAGNWLAIVTNAIGDLQTRSQIACRLLTRHTWQGDEVSLVLSLENQGRSAALQLQISLAPSPEYLPLDEMISVERLAPGDEAQVHLRVRPRLEKEIDHFRARFVIHFTDPRGPSQVENFADVVHLMTTESEFSFIPNPYVVGTPLKTGSPLFFGREDVVQYIQSNLTSLHRNNLVLIGQRRTGKTSLLKQLPARLSSDTLPVYLDGQTLGLDPGMANFFLTLSTEIAFALEDHGFEIETPELEHYQDSPAKFFEHDCLQLVRTLIGDRHILIMFDEFEELETAVGRGYLEPSIFGFLRHLIQHIPNLSVIFCGTHRLEQLAADYWNVLFNISLYHQIGFLEREEALPLIQDPVATYGMRYDDLALEKIWRVTAGHPYFLQLLCHSLVNHHNKTKRNYVTIADVNTALEEILASGEAHFVYLWTQSAPEERLVLIALSRLIPFTGQATLVQLLDFFSEHGVTVERLAIQAALDQLVLRDILQSNPEGMSALNVSAAFGDVYRWKLGLLGLWAEKYKSLTKVVDEVAQHLAADQESSRPSA